MANFWSKDNYFDDELDGELFEWYENGNMDYKATYIKGKLNGSFTHWCENGKLNFECNNTNLQNGLYIDSESLLNDHIFNVSESLQIWIITKWSYL